MEALLAKTSSVIYQALGEHRKAHRYETRSLELLRSNDEQVDEDTAFIERLKVLVPAEMALARAYGIGAEVSLKEISLAVQYSEGLNKLIARIPNLFNLDIAGRHGMAGLAYCLTGKDKEAKAYFQKALAILESCCSGLIGLEQRYRTALRYLEQGETFTFD